MQTSVNLCVILFYVTHCHLIFVPKGICGHTLAETELHGSVP